MSDYQTDFPCCDAKDGHNTEDRLVEIERRFNATFDDLDTRDIHWLISEVRRYRDEESPHVAAKYYRTIQTQRRMIENQAATIERMQRALSEIDRTGCEKSTYRRCFDTPGLTRDAAYWNEKWCDACVAADALGRES